MGRSSRRKYNEWSVYASAARDGTNKLLAELALETEVMGPAGVIDFSLVRFGRIDAVALEQFNLWSSDFGFPWHDSPGVIKNDSRHLDLSLWYGDILCGLCFATPSGKRTVVRIKLLEGQPQQSDGPHRLKGRVIELCVLAVTQYCKIIGATSIEIEKPLPGAIPVYVRNDFEMVDGVLVLSLDA